MRGSWNTTSRRIGSSLVVAVLTLCGLAAPAAADGGAQPCLVVDTDVGLDDFRAVAVLLPERAPQAVVVTEGIAAVPGGSTAMAMFLASAPSSAPVIRGLAATDPPDYDWLPDVRAGAERLNGFLAQADRAARRVDRLTGRCKGADVGDIENSVAVDVRVAGVTNPS